MEVEKNIMTLLSSVPFFIMCVFIFVIVGILINVISLIVYNVYSRKLYKNLCDETVQSYTKCLSKILIYNHPTTWNKIRATFNYVNNSDKISTYIKNELYTVASRKGCNLGNVKIKKSVEEW